MKKTKNETIEEIFQKKTSPKKEIAEKIGEVKKDGKKIKKVLKISAAAVVVIAILAISGTAFYFYRQYKKAVAVQAPPAEEKKESQKIIEDISQFMDLPQGEEPTLATVTDIEKAKSQPFFAKAENGDKVLIYTGAKKAILYRPSVKRIIEVATVSSLPPGENNAASADTSSAGESNQPPESSSGEGQSENTGTPVSVKVAVYNGASIKGLAAALAEKISAIAGTEIIQKTNAVGNYAKTIVVDLTGGNQELAQKIAQTLGGEVGNLPDGETKPDADILIIGGRDQK